MLGMTQRGISEERADRGEPGVTSAHAIFPSMFEMVEEGADERGIEVADVQLFLNFLRSDPDQSRVI
jgi:hypothetical protein